MAPIEATPANTDTDFQTDRIYNFVYSRDDRSIAFARGSNSPDAVHISEQK